MLPGHINLGLSGYIPDIPLELHFRATLASSVVYKQLKFKQAILTISNFNNSCWSGLSTWYHGSTKWGSSEPAAFLKLKPDLRNSGPTGKTITVRFCWTLSWVKKNFYFLFELMKFSFPKKQFWMGIACKLSFLVNNLVLTYMSLDKCLNIHWTGFRMEKLGKYL